MKKIIRAASTALAAGMAISPTIPTMQAFADTGELGVDPGESGASIEEEGKSSIPTTIDSAEEKYAAVAEEEKEASGVLKEATAKLSEASANFNKNESAKETAKKAIKDKNAEGEAKVKADIASANNLWAEKQAKVSEKTAALTSANENLEGATAYQEEMGLQLNSAEEYERQEAEKLGTGKEDLEVATADYEAKLAENKRLQAAYEKAVASYEALKASQDAAQKNAEEKAAALAEAADALAKSQKELDEAAAAQQELEEAANAAKEETEAAQQEVTKLTAKKEEAAQEVAEQEGILAQAQGVLDAKKAELSAAQGAVLSAQQEYEAAAAEKERLESESQAAREALESAQAAKEAADQEVEDATAALEEAKAVIDESGFDEEDIAEKKLAYDQALEAKSQADDTLAEAQAAKTEAESKFAEASSTEESTKSALEEATRVDSEKQQALAQAQEDFDAAAAKLEEDAGKEQAAGEALETARQALEEVEKKQDELWDSGNPFKDIPPGPFVAGRNKISELQNQNKALYANYVALLEEASEAEKEADKAVNAVGFYNWLANNESLTDAQRKDARLSADVLQGIYVKPISLEESIELLEKGIHIPDWPGYGDILIGGSEEQYKKALSVTNIGEIGDATSGTNIKLALQYLVELNRIDAEYCDEKGYENEPWKVQSGLMAIGQLNTNWYCGYHVCSLYETSENQGHANIGGIWVPDNKVDYALGDKPEAVGTVRDPLNSWWYIERYVFEHRGENLDWIPKENRQDGHMLTILADRNKYTGFGYTFGTFENLELKGEVYENVTSYSWSQTFADNREGIEYDSYICKEGFTIDEYIALFDEYEKSVRGAQEKSALSEAREAFEENCLALQEAQSKNAKLEAEAWLLSWKRYAALMARNDAESAYETAKTEAAASLAAKEALASSYASAREQVAASSEAKALAQDAFNKASQNKALLETAKEQAVSDYNEAEEDSFAAAKDVKAKKDAYDIASGVLTDEMKQAIEDAAARYEAAKSEKTSKDSALQEKTNAEREATLAYNQAVQAALGKQQALENAQSAVQPKEEAAESALNTVEAEKEALAEKAALLDKAKENLTAAEGVFLNALAASDGKSTENNNAKALVARLSSAKDKASEKVETARNASDEANSNLLNANNQLSSAGTAKTDAASLYQAATAALEEATDTKAALEAKCQQYLAAKNALTAAQKEKAAADEKVDLAGTMLLQKKAELSAAQAELESAKKAAEDIASLTWAQVTADGAAGAWYADYEGILTAIDVATENVRLAEEKTEALTQKLEEAKAIKASADEAYTEIIVRLTMAKCDCMSLLTVDVPYRMIEDTATPFVVIASGELEYFEAFLLDGKVVDPANYTVQRGSTRVILSPAFLKSLPAGTHSFSIRYQYGDTIPETFSIKAPPVEERILADEEGWEATALDVETVTDSTPVKKTAKSANSTKSVQVEATNIEDAQEVTDMATGNTLLGAAAFFGGLTLVGVFQKRKKNR